MKKKDIVSIAILVGVILWGIFSYTVADAKEDNAPQLVKMRVTCYTAPAGAITASGRPVMEGCCAARREDLGKIAILYSENMEFIGMFEVTDTGGAKWLKNGTAIDLYKSSLDRCWEHVRTWGDYGYVMLVEADG